ncbi:MAG: pyridoxal-phosphate dependent enzyme [Chloroflexi bacterium]|nr:pyridoxal-phosphate dependent enzyme [Chloroflexota bacterium]
MPSTLETLSSIPRLSLASYPTPLEHLPRLSKELKREIYIKRDDVIGPAMGGNKTRKLEYLLADAKRRSAKKIVTFGGLQSNHARLTAAACAALGFESHLFYFAKKPAMWEGNLLINDLVGSYRHFIPFGRNNAQDLTLETTIRLVKIIATLRLGAHYFIPVGGHNWLGCLGYVRAALEIDEQARAMKIENAKTILAAGTGGTLAGLLAGLTLIDSPLKLLGIDIGKLWKGFPKSIAHLANEIYDHLCGDNPTGDLYLFALGHLRDVPTERLYRFNADDVPMIENRYVGQGYAIPNESTMNAIRKLASLEGIILDPIYTGKAFAGMLDMIARDEIAKDEPIIFLHTGGLPGLFAFENL